MKICAIISGGMFSKLEKIEEADFVIACDKGFEYAQSYGLSVNLLVGDFDSYTGILPCEISKLELPSEKDDTDTMVAVRYAVKEKYDAIYFYCAFGGRLDHMLGNIQAASFAVSNGIGVTIYDDDSVVYMLSNSNIVLRKKEGYSLSLLSISDRCEGVSIGGVKYPLHNATVENTFPIGVSNEWYADKAEISVGEGILAVINSKL